MTRHAFAALLALAFLALAMRACVHPAGGTALALVGPPYRWDDRLTPPPVPTLATEAATRVRGRTPTPSPTGTRQRPTRAGGTPTATEDGKRGDHPPPPTCGPGTVPPPTVMRGTPTEDLPECFPWGGTFTPTPPASDTPPATATDEPTPSPVPTPTPTPTEVLMPQSGAATATVGAGRELLLFPLFKGRGRGR